MRVNRKWELGKVEGAESTSHKVIGFAGVAIFFGLIMVAVRGIAFVLYSESVAKG